MTEKTNPESELAEVEAALAALQKKREALLARTGGAGVIAQGDAVAGGVVAIRGNVRDVHVVAADAGQPSPDALRRAYLYRVVERTGHLSLAGVDPSVAGRDAEASLSLDAVYTALVTQTPRGGDDLDGRPGRPDRSEERGFLSALEQLNTHRRLVLLGDPGSGKSTFVSFVAMCLAGEALAAPEVNLERLRGPLPKDDGRDEEEAQPWDLGALLPVRVVLRDFAARGLPKNPAEARARDLWSFIAGDLEACGLGEYAPQLKKELLESGGLLLLDGLDEVPDARELRQSIKKVVESFVEGFPECRVLLTSRTYAYQNQAWRLPRFVETILAPFGPGQIRRFVDRWYSHTISLGRLTDDEARGRAELLKRAVFASDRLRFLAQRPLLLTLMASLHSWRGGSLPERRERLYADTVELLLDFWERQRIVRDAAGEPILLQPSLAEWLQVDREKVRKILEEMAFDAHRTQTLLEGTADLAEGDVVGRLMRLRQDTEENPAKLVDFLSQRAGILEPRGVGVYTFPHRTFQEYLAACHLTSGGFDEEEIAGLARQDPNRWREVVLLAAAKVARGGESGLWHLVRALCRNEPQNQACGAADEWGAQLAAQALTESADVSQVSERNREALDRVRRWLVRLLRSEELPAAERALAGRSLARLGDPRFDPDRWYLPRDPALGFVEVPGGPFLMGSDDSDEMAYTDEKPQHRLELPTFYMARFPVTVKQFVTFVEESGYESHDPDSLDGPENHPVIMVSWFDALAYCRWLSKHLEVWARDQLSEGSIAAGSWLEWMCQGLAAGDLVATLPSEAEWEKAARGTDGRRYPWGNESNPERANCYDTGILETSSVGCFSAGASSYGCEETAGNVLEWTRSLWGKSIDNRYRYPYNIVDGCEDIDAPETSPRVLRGGSFALNRDRVRVAYRYWLIPHGRNDNLGFRVAVAPFTSEL